MCVCCRNRQGDGRLWCMISTVIYRSMETGEGRLQTSAISRLILFLVEWRGAHVWRVCAQSCEN